MCAEQKRKKEGKNKIKPQKKIILITAFVFILGMLFVIFQNKKTNPKSNQKINLKNVLIITLDTTRADHIGCYGYEQAKTPNIDLLASKGILFKNAYSPVPLTLPAHCSIFTGTYPIFHKVRNNGNYFLHPKILTLAEIFKSHGYKTSAFTSSFTVDSRFGLNQGFETYNDKCTDSYNIKHFESERRAESTFKAFHIWMQENHKEKFFTWIHFFDPHFPYSPPEPYYSQFKDNHYNGEIAYMDEYVGKTINSLQSLGILEGTLIVIAGDHGEAFGEHKELGHQIFCYEENLKVPLIIFAKNHFKKNWKVSQKVNLIDIMPTILDILKIESHESLQGVSLMPALNGLQIQERDFYFESFFAKEIMGCAPVIGILQKNFKFIDLPKPELYDLKTDSFEKKNLILEQSSLAIKMKKEMKELIKRNSKSNFKSKRTLSSKEKAKLATLGYLTSSPSKQRTKAQNLADPKDKIDAFLEYTTANIFRRRGESEKAQKGYIKSIEMNPRFAPAYAKLAKLYSKMNKTKEAITILKKGMITIPHDLGLKIEYTTLLFKLNKFDTALSLIKSIKKDCTADMIVNMYLLHAQIYEKLKDLDKAIIYYKKAHKIEPENIKIMKKLIFLLHSINQISDALVIYRKLEKQNPNDFDLIHDMAILYGQTGDFESSEKYFQKSLSMKPKPNVYFDYAVILSLKKDFRGALLNMNKFLSLIEKNDPLYKTAFQLIKNYKTLLREKEKIN